MKKLSLPLRSAPSAQHAGVANWDAETWQNMSVAGKGPLHYQTRFKAARTDAGLAFLIDCEDRRLDCTMTRDQDPLFKEDVVEIFIQPDASFPVYIEYELSPLNYEVLIQVVNTHGRFNGWQPWNMPEASRPVHSVSVRGGEAAPGAEVEGWTAEVLFPWPLFSCLPNQDIQSGTEWRANVYRIDYAEEGTTHWTWDPETGTNFHKISGFGQLEFVD